MSHSAVCVPAEEALKILKKGNEDYVMSLKTGDFSAERRKETTSAQQPYAVVITCSDSRVVPESVFSAGIGDIFVIRVAGNVIDDHQLGSIEYAASHLGCELVVVMGHTHCGAVAAAIEHDPEGYIKYITDEIKQAIGSERDPVKAAELNVARSIGIIERSLEIQSLESSEGLRVVGAMYDIESGVVRFM